MRNYYDDKTLIKQLKEGDEGAFRHLFDVHYIPMCNVAWGFLQDRFLAETIAGDIIFYLWEKREEIEINTSVRAYLIRSVRNRCINYLNQEYVLKESVSNPTDELLLAEGLMKSSQQHPFAILIEKELEEKIELAIQKLPKETRTVFEMSRFDGLKYIEIAEKLEISVNTVKYHIKNALSRLSKDLDKYLIFILFFTFQLA